MFSVFYLAGMTLSYIYIYMQLIFSLLPMTIKIVLLAANLIDTNVSLGLKCQRGCAR